MVNIDHYFDEVDRRRLQRARELSDLKVQLSADSRTDPFFIKSKSAIVLSYAHWEGFHNECTVCYIDFLKELGGKIRDVKWLLLLGAVEGELNSLLDRKHTFEAKCDFLEILQGKIEATFDGFITEVVKARSNLNFNRLKQTYRLLGLDTTQFDRSRIRLDKELVGWRHIVAHGETPNLTSMDIAMHIDFTNELLLRLSEQFQSAMLEKL